MLETFQDLSHLLDLFEEVVAEFQLLIGRAIGGLPGLDRLNGQQPQLPGDLFRRREGLLDVGLYCQLQELLMNTEDILYL